MLLNRFRYLSAAGLAITAASGLSFIPSIYAKTMHTLNENKILSLSYNKSGQTIIVGDIHGCLHELNDLLLKCNYNEQVDTLIIVGDLIGKGPYSSQVVERLKNLPKNCYSVIGNHDYYGFNYLNQSIEERNNNDKYVTEKYKNMMNKFTISQKQWLENLPYIIQLKLPQVSYGTMKKQDLITIVHAGIIPNIPLNQQKILDLISMRNLLKNDQDKYIATSRR